MDSNNENKPLVSQSTERLAIDGYQPYAGPAGGWGALAAVAHSIREEMQLSTRTHALLQMNQPDGFDCPGCAWPDPKHTSSFEFCENGAKAVTWEATPKRATPDFFSAHTVTELWDWSDHDLENVGRLTHPLFYNAQTDKFEEVSWPEAFSGIAKQLLGIQDPTQVDFYTSGRTSNEAAFLYQLLARVYGSNNFPDCSNMCHEPTSVGLPQSIGVGKGTVSLDDFELADIIFCVGHNPGTNHPRMLTSLRQAELRGAKIIVINPLLERGLQRFTPPQDPAEMLTLRSTPLASNYYQVRVGGDVALIKGVIKALLQLHNKSLAQHGHSTVFDLDFIHAHTIGFEELCADIQAVEWAVLEQKSGINRAQMQEIAALYAQAERAIICYGMGITQHRHGTENVRHLVNLLLLRGNIGKAGAGICPLRGHSNVQGDRTMGITEIPSESFLERLDTVFGIQAPRAHGNNAVRTLHSILDGHCQAFIGMGGNFAVAMPASDLLFHAFRALRLNVQIITKLNRTALLTAQHTYILPCLGRTEADIHNGVHQAVTVEDSMSMVHASTGRLKPASEHLLSEVGVICGLARAVFPDSAIDWEGMAENYDLIRDKIEQVFPDFKDFNQRIRVPGGFHLPNAAAKRQWNTPSGKAEFVISSIEEDDGLEQNTFVCTTLRSHDQYNTTIYGLNDRYRGIHGRRDVVFIHEKDLIEQGLQAGSKVDLIGPSGQTLRGLTAIAYPISRKSVGVYFPEANILVGIDDYDHQSGIPAYKSIPVQLRASVE